VPPPSRHDQTDHRAVVRSGPSGVVVVRGFRRAFVKVGAAVALALAGTVVAAPVAQAQEVDSYVALGDSFSSGNGTFFPDRSLSCYRSSLAYPALVDQQRPNTDLVFRACSGATTSDVINGQVSALGAGTDLVTLTIGGNDVGFSDLILACTGSFSPTCSSTVRSAKERIATQLPARLDAVYAAIAQRAPGARVAVLGYGRFFGPNLSCSAARGVTTAEAGLLNGVADDLDAVIGARVAAAGFTYVSAIGPFTGHDVCAADPWLNGRNYSLPDIFHPTRSGHRNGYVAMVRSVLG
jgi:lysophospholipase L1-like esterase